MVGAAAAAAAADPPLAFLEDWLMIDENKAQNFEEKCLTLNRYHLLGGTKWWIVGVCRDG
jgi:hypothetical protein